MIRESFHWTGQKKGKGGDDDNATMFSGQKRLIDYCLMSTVCSVWLLRLDSGSITIFQFFSYSGCFIIFCVVVITTLHTHLWRAQLWS